MEEAATSQMRRAHRSDDDDLDKLGYYSTQTTQHRKVRNIFVLGLLVFLWYSTAVITITTSKMIMNRIKFPFLLSSVQFIFAGALSGLYLYTTKTYTAVPTGLASLVFQISASYTFGFILTNSAFSIVTAAFAETIKASEPISTVLIGLLFLNEGVSTRTYLTLLPICLGVGISCYNNDAFDALGFFLAALSNICFSTRAVLARKMSLQFPDGMDDLNLFTNISLDGLIFLLPIAFIFESRGIYEYYSSQSTIQYLDAQPQSGVLNLLGLLLVNGCMFACYNLISYLVLRRTDLITHSVLNAFRRVFIILFTTMYFNHSLSVLNCVGIVVAVVGVVLFGYFKSYDKAK